MSGKYDPTKKLRNACNNPLKLKISYEDKHGKYILTDDAKIFGRVLDLTTSAIYDTKYVAAIFRVNNNWYKYTGDQSILKDLLLKVKYIWNTPAKNTVQNFPQDFHIEDYI